MRQHVFYTTTLGKREKLLRGDCLYLSASGFIQATREGKELYWDEDNKIISSGIGREQFHTLARVVAIACGYSGVVAVQAGHAMIAAYEIR